jgi:hypothetical protein
MATRILPAVLAAKVRDIKHQLDKLETAVQFLRLDEPPLVRVAMKDAVAACEAIRALAVQGFVELSLAVITDERRAS